MTPHTSKTSPVANTDVLDAERIAQLLEHGLVWPSFVPTPDIRQLRVLTHYRVPLMSDRTWQAIGLKLILEDAPTKLSVVASSWPRFRCGNVKIPEPAEALRLQ